MITVEEIKQAAALLQQIESQEILLTTLGQFPNTEQGSDDQLRTIQEQVTTADLVFYVRSGVLTDLLANRAMLTALRTRE